VRTIGGGDDAGDAVSALVRHVRWSRLARMPQVTQ
jgi:hypothetical protein